MASRSYAVTNSTWRTRVTGGMRACYGMYRHAGPMIRVCGMCLCARKDYPLPSSHLGRVWPHAGGQQRLLHAPAPVHAPRVVDNVDLVQDPKHLRFGEGAIVSGKPSYELRRDH